MKFRIVLVLMLVFSIGMIVNAQDEDEETVEPQGLYAEIPQARGEDGAFILGDPEAEIVVMEFADFLCPHCQDYHEEVVSEFIEQFVVTGQARFEYRFFPIIDQNYSPYLAAIAECSAEQGLFWSTHNDLYEMARDGLIGADVADVVAERVGLDADLLTECLDSGEAIQYAIDTQLGTNLSVSGTPAIRVRINDGVPGAIMINGTTYNRGGSALSVLETFVTSENPEELIGDAAPAAPRLLNENLLHETGLVDGEPCDAPCWRGITPGETSWAAAEEILRADTTIADLNFQEDGDAKGATFSQVDGDACCQIITQTGEFVEFMQLQFAPGVILGDVIEKYGEPNLIDGDQYSSDQYMVILFYEDVPMLIYVYLPDAETALSEESDVIGVIYLTTDLIEQFVAASPLAEWEGYESFDYYLGGE